MINYMPEYQKKLRSPEEAVRIVKSGDWVEYGYGMTFPTLLDAALAKRRDELTDVKIRGLYVYDAIQTVECDPEQEHFIYNSWHTSPYERNLCERGLCYYTPMLYRNIFWYYTHQIHSNVAFLQATPMDEHGYFNFSVSSGVSRAFVEGSDFVVIEVNENLPKVYGGDGESIHLSCVDLVVEGEHPPMRQVPSRVPTEEEKQIAHHVIPHICDGATLQLGVGGVPDALGMIIADSDLKNLGMHTEFCSDSFAMLAEKGQLTSRFKSILPNKGIFGIAAGTDFMYDWIRDNPRVVSYRLDWVNNPQLIAKMDNYISINGCIAVDLYGQVSSESSALRHISGTGGQLDFVTGATMSDGGKSFICMSSTYTDKAGVKHSRILPHFNGDIVTTPRSQSYYIATEYGVANLSGRSSWQRAEALVSIAAPEFRDELIRAAEEQHIWRRSNKR